MDEGSKTVQPSVKPYLNKKMMKKAAAIYKKQGYAYTQAARTMNNVEDYLEKTNKLSNLTEKPQSSLSRLETVPRSWNVKVKRVTLAELLLVLA